MHTLARSARSPRRFSRMAVGLVAAAALAALGAAPASAAEAAPGTGWVRVAHLSPDTKSVDVTLTALAGGGAAFELDNVAYGAVSPYWTLQPGTYVVSMVPSDAPDGSAPVIQQSVDVSAGTPLTVAALGRNAVLSTTVFTDDLTAPADGQARVRVIQASTTASQVDVVTTTGAILASDAQQGTATPYKNVPAGPWSLDLSTTSATAKADLDLAPGSVASLFVLDDATGGLVVSPVLDSAAVGDLPTGGIQTGGGATAVHVSSAQPPVMTGVLGIGAVLALIAAAVVVLSRRSAASGR
ncbi:DUF4397 domain-containing protein [Rathayibacter sp. VKM Ac-2803]|uniref:DUF4397 domain-containing protein n=1 Tax=unclassified Rathayibacter TaxID=2609250 RepID=UPI00135A6BFB|nr:MULTISPECIES: DUF4397 domain-containing protein [unclassified Rathayibacter]MWV49616.1 DUF4397 domain-containing protein [Rathayibacter sp. VKM Ac-2803]MWV59749.1 DUF4397 domain-containing protein [Rathayibacter sp. VKM Ac-2754]